MDRFMWSHSSQYAEDINFYMDGKEIYIAAYEDVLLNKELISGRTSGRQKVQTGNRAGRRKKGDVLYGAISGR